MRVSNIEKSWERQNMGNIIGRGCIGAQNIYTFVSNSHSIRRIHSLLLLRSNKKPNGLSFELMALFFHISYTLSSVSTYLRLGVEFQCQYTKYRFSSFTNYMSDPIYLMRLMKIIEHPYKGEIRLDFENEQR